MRHLIPYTLLFSLVFWAACGSSGESETPAPTQPTEPEPTTETVDVSQYVGDVIAEGGGLKLHELVNSPQYVTATLKQDEPSPDKNYMAGPVHFKYEVDNYELGAQTLEGTPLANSGKGQHIHLILNNGPYTAHYDPEFDMDMEAGDYVALAFLSRSYHESVKNAGSYALYQFPVGSDKLSDPVDLTQPLMFYSRPKGTYKGADTKYVLLDFFMVNADLSEDGYIVKATINGTEFTLTTWKPYVIEGLPMGENTIKLELFNADGTSVANKFNPVERTFTLAPENS